MSFARIVSRERDQHRMRWPAAIGIDQPQFVFPGVEQLQCARGVRDFIAQIVRPAAIRVYIVKMLMQAPRQQPGNHVEIFVVVRG